MQVRRGSTSHLFEVESDTDADKWHQVFANGTVMKCTCKGYLRHKQCKHLTAVQQYLQHTEGGIEEEEAGAPASSAPSSIARWIKKIHGKEFIQYEGLLAMAHEQGLQEMGAGFMTVSEIWRLPLPGPHSKMAGSSGTPEMRHPTTCTSKSKRTFPELLLREQRPAS
jgi:hypothetical protein